MKITNQISIDPSKIEEGLRVLKRIQEDYPGAALAGGYLRDAVLGGKPKDIDIFIPYQPDSSCVSIVGYGGIEMQHAKYMPQSEVTRVWDIFRGNCIFTEVSLDVQIIMLNTGLNIEERIKQYDFGLCQIWTTNGVIYATESFMNDINNNTCTLVQCEDEVQFQRSMKRFSRFKEKYPDLLLRMEVFHE